MSRGQDRVRRVLAAAATAVMLALGATACGDAVPAEDVPALESALERVDDAIVAGEPGKAAAALDEIEQATRRALDDETLSDADAGRILAAVGALREALGTAPEDTDSEKSPDQPESESESESEAPPSEPILPELTEPDGQDGEGEDQGEGNDKDKGKDDEKKDKDKKDD